MGKTVTEDFADFSKYLGSGVSALFSFRASGDMKDSANMEAFARRHFSGAVPVYAGQSHGTVLKEVDVQALSPLADVDALVTRDKNVVLLIYTADCIPVYFYDAQASFAGIIHAGWRGISKNIIISTMDSIEKKYPLHMSSLKTVIGPGICRRHFEVSKELAHVFPEIYVKNKKGKKFVDLKLIIRQQLESSGVKPQNIHDSGFCSFEDENIFSYRRDKSPERGCAFIRLL
ncbi:MAG: polyphenol oxidase family protein [Candidatus Omnitrophota bacterium]|nr:polyphenol oxidase family protein [bacterium]